MLIKEICYVMSSVVLAVKSRKNWFVSSFSNLL